MRNDLPKLMKDSSRIRYRAKYPKGRKRANERMIKDDSLPSRESVSRLWGQQLRERGLSLKPLRRYLTSQVGRVWDDVYSDLCGDATIGGGELVYEMRRWIDFIVELNVQMIDGKPYTDRGFEISGCGWRELWVHPETGILMMSEKRRYRYRRPRKIFEQHDLGNGRRAVKLNGIWYEVELKPIPTAPENHEDCPVDVIFGEKVIRHSRYWHEGIGKFKAEWGSAVYAASKLQMNKREIRRLTGERG